MKLALRYIPTEVWIDIFRYPWISRKRLAKIVHKFRNQKFIEFLQFYLHDWGKRTLSGLYLGETTLQTLPQTPMPENIKFFEHIRIGHFDTFALDFLHRISALFLFNEVNLDFDTFGSGHRALASVRTILGHLAPLLHGIHSLAFDHIAIPLVEQYFTAAKLAQVKLLSIDLDHDDDDPLDPAQTRNFCLNWLTSEEQDPAEPKFLDVCYCSGTYQQFSMAVQQQFQSAKRPSTFVIKFHCYRKHDFHLDLENNIGEQLDGQFDKKGNFWIYRHPMGSNRSQLQVWVNEMVEKHDTNSIIKIYPEMIIGKIIAISGANEVDDNGEEEADQPSTSNMS